MAHGRNSSQRFRANGHGWKHCKAPTNLKGHEAFFEYLTLHRKTLASPNTKPTDKQSAETFIRHYERVYSDFFTYLGQVLPEFAPKNVNPVGIQKIDLHPMAASYVYDTAADRYFCRLIRGVSRSTFPRGSSSQIINAPATSPEGYARERSISEEHALRGLSSRESCNCGMIA
jgi:hypothetical protein